MTKPTDPTVPDVTASILAAAEACFERFGITKTTMADVARAANMSRATIYRYFPDREALVMASVVRRARMNMDSARDRIRSRESFAERIVEGIIDNIRRGLRDPMVHLLVSPAEAALANTLLATSGKAVELTLELWEPILHDAQEAGDLKPDVDLNLLCEWISEIEMNYVSALGDDMVALERLREKLHAFFVPALLARQSARRS